MQLIYLFHHFVNYLLIRFSSSVFSIIFSINLSIIPSFVFLFSLLLIFSLSRALNRISARPDTHMMQNTFFLRKCEIEIMKNEDLDFSTVDGGAGYIQRDG